MAISTVGNTLLSNNSKSNRTNRFSKVTASGGTETTSGGYKVHTFTSSSVFNVTVGGTVEVFAIGGGAGGGHGQCGTGGGAGGVVFTPNQQFISNAAYTVTCGNYGGTNSGGGNTTIVGTGVSITAGGGGIPTTGTPDSFTNSGSQGHAGGAGAGGNTASLSGGPGRLYLGNHYGGGGGSGGRDEGGCEGFARSGGTGGGGSGINGEGTGGSASGHGSGGGGGGRVNHQNRNTPGGNGSAGIVILRYLV
jgi:hypothetical protein